MVGASNHGTSKPASGCKAPCRPRRSKVTETRSGLMPSLCPAGTASGVCCPAAGDALRALSLGFPYDKRLQFRPAAQHCFAKTGILITFIGLSGCASAHVTRVQEFTAIGPPNRILVETSLPKTGSEPGPDIVDAASFLQNNVLKDLIKVSIPAADAAKLSNATGMGSSDVILDMRIVLVDSGDLAERLAFGFGLRQSTLLVKVSFFLDMM